MTKAELIELLREEGFKQKWFNPDEYSFIIVAQIVDFLVERGIRPPVPSGYLEKITWEGIKNEAQ